MVVCGAAAVTAAFFLSACWDHAVFEPLLWSWQDKTSHSFTGMLGETPACLTERKVGACARPPPPLMDNDFDLSHRLQLT